MPIRKQPYLWHRHFQNQLGAGVEPHKEVVPFQGGKPRGKCLVYLGHTRFTQYHRVACMTSPRPSSGLERERELPRLHVCVRARTHGRLSVCRHFPLVACMHFFTSRLVRNLFLGGQGEHVV
jgi:hypothetical protein